MWPFRNSNKKKSPQRRLNGRGVGAAAGTTRWQWFRQAGGIGSVAFAAGLLLAAVVMDAWPLEPLPYRQGDYLDRDVFSRVTFWVESASRTEQMRRSATSRTPAVIALDEALLGRIVAELKSLPGALKAATQPAQLDESLRKRFDVKSPQDLKDFAEYAAAPKADAYARQIDRLRKDLLRSCVLTGADYSRAYHARETEQVRVREAAGAELRPKGVLISLNNTRGVDAFLVSATAPLDAAVRDNILCSLRQGFAAEQVLYRLDVAGTQAAEEAAREAVPVAIEPIAARTLLVRANAGRGLNEAEVALLSAEHTEYLRQRDGRRPWGAFWVFLGRLGMIGAVVVLLCLYVSKYEPAVLRSPLRGLAVATLLAAMLLLSKITIGTGGWNPYLAVFCVFSAGAILTIAFDQRFAFAVAGALVVLTALQIRAGLGELLVLSAAAAVAVFQLREVRSRSKLIKTGWITAAAVFVGVWAVEAAGAVPARFALVEGIYAVAAALAGGFLTQGILPLIERIFGVATSLTLLEWCDANKPLLKRVALEAPGTYSHSLMLGTMSEAAAQAIGANGLLARVGAYYHDVGKIDKPDYFIENQPGPGSKHDKLSPAMSLLIIKGHVKDGLELARQYGLPQALREFITSHHGTTLVEYFFHAAAQQRREEAERAPDEAEFRYPGPKPTLKEAAILMLADAAESAVRAMHEPTPGRIETQVHQVIHKRLMDGQLDECEMTLKEVHAIETSLVKSLCGIHHARVQYPSQKENDQADQDKAKPAPEAKPAAEGDKQAEQPAKPTQSGQPK